MRDFRFSESEWDVISTELVRIGRLKDQNDRESLEFICGGFTKWRPRLGKNIPKPKAHQEAWLEVADAARQLKRALADLRRVDASAFESWASELPELIEIAKTAAKLELIGARPKVTNKQDPMRDRFVMRLAGAWAGYGGQISHAENGPCLRFLMAVTASALKKAGEKPMNPGTIQGIIRRVK